MADLKHRESGRGGKSHIRLGQVLVEEELLTKRQLKRALAEQKRLKMGLGHTLVELGMLKEEQIVAAFNRRYGAKFTRLDADFESFLRRRGFKAEARWYSIRIPIRAKLSIVVIFIIGVTTMGLSWLVFERQRTQLGAQTVNAGKIVLSYVANNAVVPLLNLDVLALNTLLKEAIRAEALVYASVVDRTNRVQAHTDPSRIRQQYEPPPQREAETVEGAVRYFAYQTSAYSRRLDLQGLAQKVVKEGYTLAGIGVIDELSRGLKDLFKSWGLIGQGTRVVDISTPVQYAGKALGTVHVGISQDFIVEQVIKESLFILMMSLPLIGVGLVIALFMAKGFSSPLSELLVATQEISLGNLRYKIRRMQNDELGDLATAFNFMSDELHKKSLMQDSFGKYVGTEVLELIMTDPSNAMLKGTRSNVSVLFTDVRGFTSYSEQHTPEEVVEALNMYFDIATRHIQEHGGYVDKFIGDAVMGVFGVPVPTQDHAEQAVRAALTMQAEYEQMAVEKSNTMLAHVGIGINTGSVVSGNIGSQDKLEYTVIGDAVNVASRLNGLAKAGETIVSAEVRDAVKVRMKLEELKPQKVKGKAEAIPVFRVISIMPRPAEASAAAGAEEAGANA